MVCVQRRFSSGGPESEADVPTEGEKAQAHARISCSDANAGWAHRAQAAQGQRPPPADGLKPEQFRITYRQGRRASNDLVTVHVRSNGLPKFRLGIAVPGRAGNAVVRNRIKRRIREAFRALRPTPEGVDLVVVPKAAAGNARFSELVGALQHILDAMKPQGP